MPTAAAHDDVEENNPMFMQMMRKKIRFFVGNTYMIFLSLYIYIRVQFLLYYYYHGRLYFVSSYSTKQKLCFLLIINILYLTIPVWAENPNAISVHNPIRSSRDQSTHQNYSEI